MGEVRTFRTYGRAAADRLALRGLTGYCLIVLAFALAEAPLHAADANHTSARPSIVIPVEPLGYGPPGELYLTMRLSQVSLNFLDAGHLLFTFQKKGLLRRSTDNLPDDDDQLIHAVVLELPGGKVNASADWRMHDQQRYLWPLGSGTFLVRQRDSLFLTDSSLQLGLYGRFPGRLVGVQLSPGGDLLVAQTEEAEDQLRSLDDKTDKQEEVTPAIPASGQSRSSNAKPILLRVLRLRDRVVIAKSRVRLPTNLPINGKGFVESVEGKPNQWTLSFAPFSGAPAAASPKPFAVVSSTCHPIPTFVSEETLLVIRCTRSNDHLATFLNLDGKLLWEHQWQSRGEWPTWAYSEDGSRFAMGTRTGPANFPDPDSPGSSEIPGQRVDVFDTAGGKLLLSAAASPVYGAGQNFALSADGRRLVILHSGAIEVYDLPAEVK